MTESAEGAAKTTAPQQQNLPLHQSSYIGVVAPYPKLGVSIP